MNFLRFHLCDDMSGVNAYLRIITKMSVLSDFYLHMVYFSMGLGDYVSIFLFSHWSTSSVSILVGCLGYKNVYFNSAPMIRSIFYHMIAEDF